MSKFEFSRRRLVGTFALTSLASVAMGSPARQSQSAITSAEAVSFDLEPRPTRVFKTADHSHEDTESWIFSLIVQTRSDIALKPSTMKIALLKKGAVVRTEEFPAAGLEPLTYHSSFPPRLADGSVSPTPIFWPFVLRLRATVPQALDVDAMRIEVAALDTQDNHGSNAIIIPIEIYQQKTVLIFPFNGKGIILQGGATNGGHRNRSGSFAIDACGLDDAWSVEKPGDGKKNTDYPGWGRPIIAPAAGRVVHARSDRPDQPVGDESSVKYFAPEFQKQGGGDPGNHLVIDHGSNEFSMIAHFMAGSMLVKQGDHVAQAQVLGKLGHSGDTDTPHVHYQLQAGPDWENSDGLPFIFTNVDQTVLDRGTYFYAK